MARETTTLLPSFPRPSRPQIVERILVRSAHPQAPACGYDVLVAPVLTLVPLDAALHFLTQDDS